MIRKQARKSKRFPIILLSGCLIWLMLPDEIFAQGRTDLIVETGQIAPDGNGTIASFGFNAPVLNDSGAIAVFASLAGTSGGDLDDKGIFRSNGGALTQIARKGGAAPDGNGTFSSLFSSSSVPELNDSGAIAFSGQLTGTSGGDSDNKGIFRGSGGSLTQIARTGDTAPDGNGNFSSLRRPTLSDFNTVSFHGSLSGTSGGSADDSGIFRSSGSSLIQIVREGEAAPDGNGTFSGFSNRGMNDSGAVVVSAFLTGTSGGGTDNRGIFRGNGGLLTQIARAGGAAPDGNGTFYTFGFPVLNDSGATAFNADLAGTNGGDTDDSGIFRGSGGLLTQIARTGEAAPDGNGTFSEFGRSVLNDSGTAAFVGNLTGTSGGDTDFRGIFRGSGGSLAQIARAGGTTPDGNGTFLAFSNPALNDLGTTTFVGSLTGTSGGDADNRGIYLGDGIDLIQVVREGDMISGSAISSVGSQPDLNNHGQVAYQVGLADGSELIRRFTPDLHWRSTFSSSWDVTSRWTLGLRPDEVHDVYIDPDASLTVNGPADDVTVSSLAIGSDNSNGLARLYLRSGSTLTASNGVNVFSNGVLTGDGTINGTVVNRGTVVANNLNFENGGLSIVAGSLEGTGRVNGDISNGANGNIRANNGNVLRLTGSSLTNRGRIEVIGGELEVSANVNNIAGSGLITGRDTTMRFNGGVSNQGAIAITDGINDVFGDINNTGVISVGGDAEAIFYDDITQNGNFDVSAVGSRIASAIVLGEFTGDGGFSGGGDLFLLGDLRPGNSPASVLMDGNLFLGATTMTEFEFAGDQMGEFDQLLVTGDLSLAGELSVGLLDGFEFGFNQEFIVADVGGDLFGQFAGFGEGDLIGSFGGKDLFISYSAGNGNDVSFFTAVPEPATGMLGMLALIGLSVRRTRFDSA